MQKQMKSRGPSDVAWTRLRKIVGLSSAVGATFVIAACATEHPGITHCKILMRSSHCVEVPLASDVESREARAFALPAQGKASIYLLRPYSQKRSSASRVYFDDKLFAILGPMTFTRFDVEGRHRLRIETEDSASLEYDMKAITNVYLQYQLVEAPFSIQPELSEIDEADAKKRVQRLDLVAPTIDGRVYQD